MEVFQWNDNVNNLLGRRCNIEEDNKKLYSLFTEKCDPYLKTKLKVTKGYYKDKNSQEGIKVLVFIRSVICGVEAHMQGI